MKVPPFQEPISSTVNGILNRPWLTWFNDVWISINSLFSTTTTLTTGLSSLNTEVDTLTTSTSTDIATINENITTINTDIETINEDVTTINTSISSINTILDPIRVIRSAQLTYDMPNIVAHTQDTTTVEVFGVLLYAAKPPIVIVSSTTQVNGVLYTGYVSADEMVTLEFTNVTAADINPGQLVFSIAVIEFY